MTVEPRPLDQLEQQAIIGVCILAAFADGVQGADERARILEISHGFSGTGLDVTSVYQDVLGGKFSVATAATRLSTTAARALGYEMAVCVCNADGAETRRKRNSSPTCIRHCNSMPRPRARTSKPPRT